MSEPTALGETILKHWRKYRPRMVKELSKKKQLNQAVREAQELTGDLLYELVSVKKMDYGAAWELAMREWALLPQEPPPQRTGAAKSRKRRFSRKSHRSKRRHRRTSG